MLPDGRRYRGTDERILLAHADLRAIAQAVSTGLARETRMPFACSGELCSVGLAAAIVSGIAICRYGIAVWDSQRQNLPTRDLYRVVRAPCRLRRF